MLRWMKWVAKYELNKDTDSKVMIHGNWIPQ